MIFINPSIQGTFSMIPDWLMDRTELQPGAKLAYARLVRYAAKDGVARPRQQTLAGELGVGERQARRYVAELEEQGLIHITQRGLGRSNEYRFLEHEWMAAPVPDPDPDGGPPGPDEDDRSRSSADTDVPSERTNVARLSGRTRPEQRKRQLRETTGRENPSAAGRRRRGKTQPEDEPLAAGQIPMDGPAEEIEAPAKVTTIRTAADRLVQHFVFVAKEQRPGDSRNRTKQEALKGNVRLWLRRDGVSSADIEAAMDLFFVSEHFMRTEAQFWESFVKKIDPLLTKVRAGNTAELSDEEWVAAQTAKAVDPESLTDEEWAARQRLQYGGAA